MPYAPHRLTLLVALLATVAAAHAQPAPAASQPSVTERAQRDADKVFQMILQHADKPRRVVRDERAAAPGTAPAPAVVPVRAAARSPAGAKALPAEPTAVNATPVQPSATAEARVIETAPPPATDAPKASVAAAAQPAVVAALPAAPAPVESAAPRSAKLELVSSVEPEFPARLVQSLGAGSVTVKFDVQVDGTVSRTEVVRSSHRGLNAAAQTAVAAWRFKPLVEGRPGVVELKFE